MGDNRSILLLLCSIGVVALCLIVRWIISKLFNAGFDAITHKVNEKKNAETAGNSQSLADRYNQTTTQAPVATTVPSEKAAKMYCKHCGEQLTEGTVFCSKCGTKVE